MGLLRWIAGVLFTLAAVIFAIANIRPVSIVWSPLHSPAEMPLSLACLLAFAIGFLLGVSFMWVNNFSLHIKNRRCNKRLAQLEKDISKTGQKQAVPKITDGSDN
jgi:uncharacterized integral membrane protein